ncbi:PBP1A family penicillin-binding protein [Bacillaceae bacterium Marseille-Q3522]|nr:PBP1A family penicillin-binding protein [Bacillaceae bacterium Marseille-Q3522]
MELIANKHFRKTMKYLRFFLFVSIICMAVMLCFIIGILTYAKVLGPPPLAVPQSTLYYADDGSIIGESHSGQKRYWVSLAEMSPNLVKATVAIEDRNFYHHHGFDYKRMIGAALADLKAMSMLQGASTISQQYARNLFLEHEKSWKRKLLEAFYTIRIEMNYSKKEILEGYLNTIYYGHGAYGAEAASQYYFGKSSKQLTLAEAAMLAGIPKGPSLYSPFASLEKAKTRQEIILQSMVNNDFIKQPEADNAEKETFSLVGEHAHKRAEIAPYFQDAVRQVLKNDLKFDEKTIDLGGLKIYTTVQPEQQKIAEETIGKMIPEDSDMQVGFVAISPRNGYVTAMVGGTNYKESPFNRATQAIRQPGSTFKPFLYYAALENGFTPSTVMRSEETTFRFDNGQAEYTPHNFNHHYAEDDITLAQAIALSDNIYAVKTHLLLGEEKLVNTAKKFGITTKLDRVPSLALGSSGVRVIDMAGAYSLFANGGKKITPTLIKRVEDYHGNVLYERKTDEKTVLKPELAFVMTDLLSGVFDKKLNGYTQVTGTTIMKHMTRVYAGKSGTTDSDSWMIGYSPELVSAVWTGYDQGQQLDKPLEKTYAKNIWIHFMEDALKGKPLKTFKPPENTIGVLVNPVSGKLATEQCPVKRFSYYVAGTEPSEYCTDHVKTKEQKKEKKGAPMEKEKPLPWYKRIFRWN